jgi:ornithine cyclodeaminase/alanine dehydrogenase-like protein (mu-crystallin family)
MLVLNKTEIDGLLSWPEIISICENVFRWIDEGEIAQDHMSPIYYSLRDGHQAFALPFPACIKPLNVVGNKWGGGSRQNRAKGLPSFIATISLNDAETGMPVALLEGTSITSMRTAGHAAIGAKYLARPDSSTVAIVGCGAEGGSFLSALNTLFDLKKVNAVAKHPESAQRYASTYGEKLNLDIEPFDTPQEAVNGADIICMCSSAAEPVVFDEWIAPGAHVAATRAFIDYDPKFSSNADKWVLGYRETDGQWLKKPPFSGIRNLSIDSVYADMVEIIAGRKPGRENAGERTIMTHMGMGALDVAVAHEVYQRAKSNGIGRKIELF